MFDRIGFVIGEAFIALRRNGFMTFAAISTVAVSLFLLGGLVYILYGAQQYAETLPSKFEIRLFLKDGTSYRQIQDTARQIRAIPGVKDANWIPRDKAWALAKKRDPEVTEGVENPYPDAFKITLTDLQYSDTVVNDLRKLPVTDPNDGIQHLGDVERFVEQVLNVLRWFGGVLGGTLFITAGILIYIAIRMTIVSRRREVRIMQLVGASRLTIHVPFLIEGLFQGIAGGTLAAALLSGAYFVIVSQKMIQGLVHLMNQGASVQSQIDAASAALGFATQAVPILGIVGGAYGLLCSLVAANAPLSTS